MAAPTTSPSASLSAIAASSRCSGRCGVASGEMVLAPNAARAHVFGADDRLIVLTRRVEGQAAHHADGAKAPEVREAVADAGVVADV